MPWQLKVGLGGWLLVGLIQPCWAKIELSEIYPRPSQGDEWVELHSTNTTPTALQGWQLWDELSQPSLIYSFTTETIGPESWLVVPINHKLNDSGDGVTVKDTAGTVIDFVQYDSAPADLSWAKIGETWIFTSASPGLANPIPTPMPTSTPLPTTTPKPSPSPTPTPTNSPTPTIVISMTPSTIPTLIEPVVIHSKPSAASTLLALAVVSPSPRPQPTPSAILTSKPDPTQPPIATSKPTTLLSLPKIVPWVNAIMAALTLNSSMVCVYYVSRYFTAHASSLPLTSSSLVEVSPLDKVVALSSSHRLG